MNKKGIFKGISDGLFEFIKNHSVRVCPDGKYDNKLECSQFALIKQIQSYTVDRNAKIELLESYSKYLEEHYYMDTDWRTEKPCAIDEFFNQLKK